MSATNGHPGLTFGGSLTNSIRQGRPGAQAYPPPPSNKPVQPVLPQHAASYSHYTAHQPPSTTYSQLYSTSNPSPVHGTVPNGSRSQQQSQAQLPVPGSRPRAAPQHRQIPPQSSNNALGYIPTTLPQQHLSQQQLSTQSIGQQPMNQQSMGQQPLGQAAISQQALNQQAISQQAINHQQTMAQENSLLSQPAPSHSHPVLTPQPAGAPQQQKTPQPAQPPILHADGSVQLSEQQVDGGMEVESPSESVDGEDSTVDNKNGENGSPFVPRTPMGAMMSAPPQGGSYPTLDAVHKAVLEYCTSVGYAIVIGRSKKTVPGLKKVLFVCDRAGKPPKRVSPEMRKRKTSSRKCDCQFGFFAIEQRTQWTVRYRPDAAHLQHNHGPSESPLLHPAARKLDSKMVATVKNLKEQGVGVSQTLEILQSENPSVPLLPRDIYNARAAISRNPSKITDGLAEDRPAIYSKPRPSAEERIISDLRKELAKVNEELDKIKENHQKELEELEEKVREKDKQIKKYEMFVDICNERVMFQREKLKGLDDNSNAGSVS